MEFLDFTLQVFLRINHYVEKIVFQLLNYKPDKYHKSAPKPGSNYCIGVFLKRGFKHNDFRLEVKNIGTALRKMNKLTHQKSLILKSNSDACKANSLLKFTHEFTNKRKAKIANGFRSKVQNRKIALISALLSAGN